MRTAYLIETDLSSPGLEHRREARAALGLTEHANSSVTVRTHGIRLVTDAAALVFAIGGVSEEDDAGVQGRTHIHRLSHTWGIVNTHLDKN